MKELFDDIVSTTLFGILADSPSGGFVGKATWRVRGAVSYDTTTGAVTTAEQTFFVRVLQARDTDQNDKTATNPIDTIRVSIPTADFWLNGAPYTPQASDWVDINGVTYHICGNFEAGAGATYIGSLKKAT